MPDTRKRIGLALAGGGPEGAIYEIGALRALEDVLEGLDLNEVDVYVGVSAGSFVASCLANGLTTAQLCRAIVKSEPDEHPLSPEILFTPAFGEWFGRGLQTPGMIWNAVADYVSNPGERTVLETFTRMTRLLPLGLFDGDPLRRYLSGIFAIKGRTDDFRKLRRRLIVIAADLDSGTAVRFGTPETAHVPISRAVQASSALPGLYPPVEIDGRHYVDGVLLKTLHASVALEAGAELLLCVNPIVPVDTEDAIEAGAMRRGKLVYRGLPTVLSQTFRTLVHSRLKVGMSAYETRFPGADTILFEPDRDDYRMFFTNIFSFSSRRSVCEHAYDSVRRHLAERREELEPVFARCGIRIRDEILHDADRTVWTEAGLPARSAAPAAPVTEDLRHTLTRLEDLVERLERSMAPQTTETHG
ncbi:MAG: patatin family protein [bacterium]|nr:patatin family protein [bacterium]